MSQKSEGVGGDDAQSGADELAAVDAAFERNDPEVGTAVVRLVLNCDAFDAVAARVERALRTEQLEVRRLGHVAAGDLARLSRRLTPAIYQLLRREGLGGIADTAIKDVLTFVPFRGLPPWFKRQFAVLSVRNFVEGRWLSLVDSLETLRDHLTRARR
ncbi:hypothetical protein [Kitasatospora sp. MAP5-34]|uniref:hypothetical protein n=1 Tax=Kitasatospora sp. MAP5-34 TaxID=3035102 RepID=UPI002476CE7F|nr:hypothetical protein [Kitasatospora sp. MAP5-34]MDH6580653.1 hypothetical protein [Kitasatospora sp. MAP5-34]